MTESQHSFARRDCDHNIKIKDDVSHHVSIHEPFIHETNKSGDEITAT